MGWLHCRLGYQLFVLLVLHDLREEKVVKVACVGSEEVGFGEESHESLVVADEHLVLGEDVFSFGEVLLKQGDVLLEDAEVLLVEVEVFLVGEVGEFFGDFADKIFASIEETVSS